MRKRGDGVLMKQLNVPAGLYLPVQRAVLGAMTAGVVLTLLKLAAGFAASSMAAFAAALVSAMNVALSSVHFIASGKFREDSEDERNRRGKFESFIGMIHGLAVLLTALWMVYESVRRLTMGSAIGRFSLGLILMTVSIALTGTLVRWLAGEARQNASLLLSAEGLHWTTGIFFDGAAAVSLVLVWLTRYVFWDLVVSIVVSIYIMRVAYETLRRSVDELLERSLPPARRREIRQLILLHDPAVAGIHRFRSYKAEEWLSLDFHISIDGNGGFQRAQAITESLANKILKKYPGTDVVIYFDAQGEGGRVEHASVIGRR